MSPPPPAAAATAGLPTLLPEIIDSHILTRLDGPSLASAACCSTALRRHSSHHNLWLSICLSTWPATASPRLRHLISTFPGGGPRAFFSHAFPLPTTHPPPPPPLPPPPQPLPEILSAVDIHFAGKPIFTKLHSTDTAGEWFRSSPFRVDLLETAAGGGKNAGGGDMHEGILGEMRLSWIVIDPVGRRAANLSSHEPVGVQQHWLTGEMEVRFGTVVGGGGGDVQCEIVVTCDVEMEMEVEVKGVRLEMEGMDGKQLNGEESLVILQGVLEGGKGAGKNRAAEARRRFEEFEEMKRERRERELRREGDWDMLCLALGVFVYFFFWYYFF